MRSSGFCGSVVAVLGCLFVCENAGAQAVYNPDSFSAAQAKEEPVDLGSSSVEDASKAKKVSAPKATAKVAPKPEPKAVPRPEPKVSSAKPAPTPAPVAEPVAADAVAGEVPGAVDAPLMPEDPPVPEVVPASMDAGALKPPGEAAKPKAEAKPKVELKPKAELKPPPADVKPAVAKPVEVKPPAATGKPAAESKPAEAKPPQPPKDFHADTPAALRKRLELDLALGLGSGSAYDTDLLSYAVDVVYDLGPDVDIGLAGASLLVGARYHTFTGMKADDLSRASQAFLVGGGMSYSLGGGLRVVGHLMVGATKMSKWSVIDLRYDGKAEYGFVAAVLPRAHFEVFPGIEVLGGLGMHFGSQPWYSAEAGVAARF